MKKSTKTLLKRTKVSDEHFSSGKRKEEGPSGTRCVVHIIEAKSLLASDAVTGKSDPVCFLSIGPASLTPEWDTLNPAEHGILVTPVKPSNVNPIWNVKLTFPLVVKEAEDLTNACVHILIRDEDINVDGSTSYDNLGEVHIPLRDVLASGKKMRECALVDIAREHKLIKSRDMAKVDGTLKVAVSMIFSPDDTISLQEEMQVSNVSSLADAMKLFAITGNKKVVHTDSPSGSASLRPSSGGLTARRAMPTPRVSSPVHLNDGKLKSILQPVNDSFGSAASEWDEEAFTSDEQFAAESFPAAAASASATKVNKPGMSGAVSGGGRVSDHGKSQTSLHSDNESETFQDHLHHDLGMGFEPDWGNMDEEQIEEVGAVHDVDKRLVNSTQGIDPSGGDEDMPAESVEVPSVRNKDKQVKKRETSVKQQHPDTTAAPSAPSPQVSEISSLGAEAVSGMVGPSTAGNTSTATSLMPTKSLQIQPEIVTSSSSRKISQQEIESATLRIMSISVNDVPNVETRGGKNDLFVDISQESLWQTRTDVKKEVGSSATWDVSHSSGFSFNITGADLKSKGLQVSVSDKNDWSKDVFIGRAQGNLYQAIDETDGGVDGKVDCRLALTLMNNEKVRAGTADVMFRLEDVVRSPHIDSANTPASNPSVNAVATSSQEIAIPSQPTLLSETPQLAIATKDGTPVSTPVVVDSKGGVGSGVKAGESDVLYFDENDRIAGGKPLALLKAAEPSSPILERAIVNIKSIQVANLPNVEKWGGKNDPYVILAYGDVWSKTTEAKEEKGANAKWTVGGHDGYRFPIHIEDLQTNALRITVMDKNSVERDVLIGKAESDLLKALQDTPGAMSGEEDCLLTVRLSGKTEDAGEASIVFRLDGVIMQKKVDPLVPVASGAPENGVVPPQQNTQIKSIEPGQASASAIPVPSDANNEDPSSSSTQQVQSGLPSETKDPKKSEIADPMKSSANVQQTHVQSEIEKASDGISKPTSIVANGTSSQSVVSPATPGVIPVVEASNSSASGAVSGPMKPSDITHTAMDAATSAQSKNPVLQPQAVPEVGSTAAAATPPAAAAAAATEKQEKSKDSHSISPLKSRIPQLILAKSKLQRKQQEQKKDEVREVEILGEADLAQQRQLVQNKSSQSISNKSQQSKQGDGVTPNSESLLTRTRSKGEVSKSNEDSRQRQQKVSRSSSREDVGTASVENKAVQGSKKMKPSGVSSAIPSRPDLQSNTSKSSLATLDDNRSDDGATVQSTTGSQATRAGSRRAPRGDSSRKEEIRAIKKASKQRLEAERGLGGDIGSSATSSGFFVPVTGCGDEDLPDSYSTADTVDNDGDNYESNYPPRNSHNNTTSSRDKHNRMLRHTAPAAGHRTEPIRDHRADTDGLDEYVRHSVSGHTTATVRALKELARHEKIVNSAVQEMYRENEENFRKLEDKIRDLEKTQLPASSLPQHHHPHHQHSHHHPHHPQTQKQHTHAQTHPVNHPHKPTFNDGLLHTSNASTPHHQDHNTMPVYTTQSRLQQPPSTMGAMVHHTPYPQFNQRQSRLVGAILDGGSDSEVEAMVLEMDPYSLSSLSSTVRSRLLDFISTELSRGSNTDKCLQFVHSLVHTPVTSHQYESGYDFDVGGLVEALPSHTYENLKAGLVHVSLEPSTRGVVACRLERNLIEARTRGQF